MANLVSRFYGTFRGADFRGEETDFFHSPDCLNVWRNYKELSSVQTRPRLKQIVNTEEKILGMWWYKENLLVQLLKSSDKKSSLCKVADGVTTGIQDNLSDGTLCAFVFGEMFYFLDSTGYYQYDGTGVKDVLNIDNKIVKIPKTTIGRKAGGGGGTTYEDVNMLINRRKNGFVGDGKNNFYELDSPASEILSVIVNGNAIRKDSSVDGELTYNTGYSLPSVSGVKFSAAFVSQVNNKRILIGYVTYENPEIIEYSDYVGDGKTDYYGLPECSNVFVRVGVDGDVIGEGDDTWQAVRNEKKFPIYSIIFFGEIENTKPLTDGQDNIIIEFIPYMSEEEAAVRRNKILNCSIARVFDNRVFFTGNPEHPNTIWHSSLNNPAYISDLDYYVDGIDSTKIKDMVAGNNALWVFREPTDNQDSVFYHVPTIDADYGRIYPSAHSQISLGCTGKAINFNDDVVFFSPRGMEGVNGDVTTERFAAHRSTLVDRKLLVNEDYEDMILVEWEGYLIAFMGNEAFLADSRAIFTNENQIEYEWYYWNFSDKVITSALVNKGVLYVGTADGGIYKFANEDEEGTEGEIESYWTTPKEKFGAPHKLKTTNKKGCVVEATGDIEVFVKTDNEDEFLSVGTYQDVTDYFTSQIKKKKFKDIQLKFYSKNKFTLESATLEAIIGGYIKD